MLSNITDLINRLTDIVGNGITTLLMSVAFVAFLLAVINFIWKRRTGQSEALKQAGNMLWGSVFALFVMVSVWGIVNFLAVGILGNDANVRSIERPQTNFRTGANVNSSSGRTFNSNSECQSACGGGNCVYESLSKKFQCTN
jgi:nitrogen fixation-related uncharacterized protein